jgi:hypothetical protein
MYEVQWNNSKEGPVVSLYEHGNTSESSTKCREFLRPKSNQQILKMDRSLLSYV